MRTRRQRQQDDARVSHLRGAWADEAARVAALPLYLPSTLGVKKYDPGDPPERPTVYGRGSGTEQDYSPQLRWLKALLTGAGVTAKAAAGEHASGRSLERAERPVLFKMLEKARGGVLLTAAFSRLVRAEDYHPWRNPSTTRTPGRKRTRPS